MCFSPHFVAFLGFKNLEDLFCLSFGGISHDCAGGWVSLVDLFGVVVVEEKGSGLLAGLEPRGKPKSLLSSKRFVEIQAGIG
jgi:hypothetical protein